MADLGKSQIRQLQNTGNSPAGQTGSPTGSRGNAYKSLGSVADPPNYVSQNVTYQSKSITPAGAPAPLPSKGSQHQARLSSQPDALNKPSRNTGFTSTGVTPAGSGSTENTSGHGQHYYSLNASKDKSGKTARTGGIVGGTAASGGLTQGETGGLPIAGTGGAAAHYYLRAQDQGCLPTITYVYWVSTTVSTGSYPGVLPCGGPLINLTILAKF